MADKSLVMTFLNQRGERSSITVPNIKDNLTESDVSVTMDAIIAGNIFASTGGDLVAKHSAQVTERTVTALEVR
jgi:hypothetical protein